MEYLIVETSKYVFGIPFFLWFYLNFWISKIVFFSQRNFILIKQIHNYNCNLMDNRHLVQLQNLITSQGSSLYSSHTRGLEDHDTFFYNFSIYLILITQLL